MQLQPEQASLVPRKESKSSSCHLNGTSDFSKPEALPSFGLAVPLEPEASWVLDWRADGAEVAEDTDDFGFFTVEFLPVELGAQSFGGLMRGVLHLPLIWKSMAQI